MRASTVAFIATALVAAPAAFAAPTSNGLTPRAELNARGSIEDAIVAELDKLFGQRLHRKSTPVQEERDIVYGKKRLFVPAGGRFGRPVSTKRMFVPVGGIPRPTSGKRDDALFADQVIDDGSDDSDEIVETSPEDGEDTTTTDDSDAEEEGTDDQDVAEKRLFGAEGFLLPGTKHTRRSSLKSRLDDDVDVDSEDVDDDDEVEDDDSEEADGDDVIEKRLFGSDTFLLPGSKNLRRASMKFRMIDELD